ncbi:aldehyde dehydrogenase [Pholiota molesta]|nr:aldehyde dehydrogenase [Pholiota molesta]
MSATYTHKFDTPVYKGDITIHTGLFINNKWVAPVEGKTIDQWKVITAVSVGSSQDVEIAVKAARRCAYKTSWGLRCSGRERGKLLFKLAQLIERDADEFAALEALDVGSKIFANAKAGDVGGAIATIRYYADHRSKFTYTRHEPYGAIGQIIPWNYPLFMLSWKIGPALATGNSIVSNIVNGYGNEVGQAIIEHPRIRKVLKASAETNLKVSPTIIFDDANLEKAVKWASFGILRIYDNFVGLFQKEAELLTQNTGDPFAIGTQHGPQVSQNQFNRVMGYIESGKAEGANILMGGVRHGTEGYFIKPTIITDVHLNMKLTREEIFGPVCTLIKFKTEEEAIEKGNDTEYGQHRSSYRPRVPFGGYKCSGIGRELGEYALDTYTQVKGVHINLGP